MLNKNLLHKAQVYFTKGRRFAKKTLLRKEIAALEKQGQMFYTGNKLLPEVALTFDDGPDPQYTPQILEVLERYGVKATFFCIGEKIVPYSHILRQTHAVGHTIGNHSWAHSDLGLLSASRVYSELTRTSTLIQEITGDSPTFFRPPYGSLNTHVLTQARHLGATTVMWDTAGETLDWACPGTDFIVRHVLDNVCNGTIVLMHDGGGDRSQTVAALPILIEKLKEKGFRLVTVEQMMENLHEGEQPALSSLT